MDATLDQLVRCVLQTKNLQLMVENFRQKGPIKV